MLKFSTGKNNFLSIVVCSQIDSEKIDTACFLPGIPSEYMIVRLVFLLAESGDFLSFNVINRDNNLGRFCKLQKDGIETNSSSKIKSGRIEARLLRLSQAA